MLVHALTTCSLYISFFFISSVFINPVRVSDSCNKVFLGTSDFRAVSPCTPLRVEIRVLFDIARTPVSNLGCGPAPWCS